MHPNRKRVYENERIREIAIYWFPKKSLSKEEPAKQNVGKRVSAKHAVPKM